MKRCAFFVIIWISSVAWAQVPFVRPPACDFGAGCNGVGSMPFLNNPADTGAQTTTVDPLPVGVSTVNLHSILYSGATTRTIAEYQPWWYNISPYNGHKNIGMNESLSAQTLEQAQAMKTEGFDSVVVDYYGCSSSCPTAQSATQAYNLSVTQSLAGSIAANPSTTPTFMIMLDQGAINGSGTGQCPYATSPAATAQSCIISAGDIQLDYIAANWLGQSYYELNAKNGHAIVMLFITKTNWITGINWSTIYSAWAAHATAGQPCTGCSGGVYPVTVDFLDQDNVAFGEAGMAGGFAWPQPNSYSITNQFCWEGDCSFNYLASFYSTAQTQTASVPATITVGAIYKGFDDYNASWGTNRVIAQQCGQVLNFTAGAIASAGYSSSLQLQYVMDATWHDYEEGTEVETGVKNCFTVNAPTLSGTTLSWSLTKSDATYANTSTISSFSIYTGTGSPTTLFASGISPTATSHAAPTLTPGESAYVYAIGQPLIQNQLSPALTAGTCASFVAGGCPTSVPSTVTQFYFFDYVSGSDSNLGTTESSPWQHMPSCANATGNSAAHTPAAGEGWIFKGGVTVDYHCWPANVPWGGTSSAVDYIGPDPGWFTGSAWARPIFSGGGTSLNADSIGGSLMMDTTHHASYFVLDNIEFTGFYWSTSTNCAVQSGTCGYVSSHNQLTSFSDVAWEFKNLYAHNITHAAAGGSLQDQAPYGLFWMPRDAASSFHNSYIDNTDGGDDCCGAVFTNNIYQNYFSGLDNVIYNPSASSQQTNGSIFLVHDNWITNMTGTFQSGGGAPHGNCIHVFGTEPSSYYELVYNNRIDCINVNAETFEVEEDSATVYFFNNVVTNIGQPNGFDTSSFSGAGHGGTYTYFDITEECGLDPSPEGPCSHLRNQPTVFHYNNFGIDNNNSGGPAIYAPSGWTGSFTSSPNTSLTCNGVTTTNFGGQLICNPIGSGNGTGNLNLTQTYPFAPLDATAAATIGTGPSRSSLCATISGINAAAGTACLSDTTLGVAPNTSTHAVSFPDRAPIARPTGGTSWRNGAYEYSTASYTLTVAVSGSGAVSSVPSGIAVCTAIGGVCSASFPAGTSVVLTATPASGYVLQTWATAGCGHTGTCTVIMNSVQQASAIFTTPVSLLPQIWVDNNEYQDGSTIAPIYELNLATQSWVGGMPSGTFHLPYWTIGTPTCAGAQLAWNDVEAYRTSSGNGVIIDMPEAVFSCTSGLYVNQSASTLASSFIIVRSVGYANLPDGTTVCSHGIQDNLSTSTDPGLENADCAGDAMSYQLGTTVTAVPSGSFTFANGTVVNTSSYDDVQYMFTLEGTGSSPTAIRFCSPVGGGALTATVPACTSTTLAPDHWVFLDAEFRIQAGNLNNQDIVSMPGSGNETATSQYPTHIHFRKDWAHGDWTSLTAGLNSVSNGWDSIGQYISIVDSQVSQVLRPGSEGHGILFQGTQAKINHNWVEGQSIGILSGGQCTTPSVSGYVAFQSIEERRNRLTFPWTWLGVNTISGNAHWNGANIVRKNANEIKSGQFVVRDGNIMENVDTSGGQGGVLGDIKTVNDSCGFGTNYQNIASDITDSNNIWRNGLETFELVRNPGSVGGSDLGIRRASISNSIFYNVNETNFGGSENQGIQINQQAWAWQGTVTQNANGTATFVAACSVNAGGCKGQVASVSVSGFTGAGSVEFSAPNLQGGMLAVASYNSSGIVTISIAGSGYTSITCVPSTGGACSATLNASSTTPPTGFQALDMLPGDPATLYQCSSVTSFNQPLTSYSSGYLPSQSAASLGAIVIPGVNPASLTTTFAWPTSTTPTGSSDSAGYCKLTNMQGFPQAWTGDHITAVQNSTNGLTFSNGFSNFITNGPNFQAFTNLTNSIISNGGITNSSGIASGSSTVKFNIDTTNSTISHLLLVGVNSASYTSAFYGNNPNNPIASPILYYPATAYCTGASATSACAGFVGTEYYSASSMVLAPSDYHDLGVASGTFYASGGAGQASDGTSQGTIPSAIDAAQTMNLYVCGSMCGSGPFPDTLDTFTITVTILGSGTVTDSLSGINCPTTCSATYDVGDTDVLTASASGGYSFTGWTDGCSGISTCTLTTSAAPVATFTPTASPFDLNVTPGNVFTKGNVLTQ
jgi:hypothetical protein